MMNTDEAESSNEGKAESCRMFIAPLGPSSAAEFDQNGRMLCYEEKTNRIIALDCRTGVQIAYLVHKDFGFEKYYWSQIVCFEADILLVLLKHHATRMFWLFTFELLDDKRVAVSKFKLKTRIRSNGYRVSAQTNHNLCYFSFCNVGKHGRALEAVLLKAWTHGRGRIHAEIVSLGRDRFCLEFAKPCIQWDKQKRKSSFTGMKTHYMTRLPSVSLMQPVFYADTAVFVDKTNSQRATAVKAIAQVQYGLKAALLSTFTLSKNDATSPAEDVCLRAENVEMPANWPAVWSNAIVLADSAFYYVHNADEGHDYLWRLNLKSYKWSRVDVHLDCHRLQSNVTLRLHVATGTVCLRGRCVRDTVQCPQQHHFVFFQCPHVFLNEVRMTNVQIRID